MVTKNLTYHGRRHLNLFTNCHVSWNISSQGIISVWKHFLKSEYFKIIFFLSHDLSSFPCCPFYSHFLKKSSFFFDYFLVVFTDFFFIDFDGYYIVKTDEGQPRPKYIYIIKQDILIYKCCVWPAKLLDRLGWNFLWTLIGRAGRHSWGTIFLSQERMERSRMIPSLRKYSIFSSSESSI